MKVRSLGILQFEMKLTAAVRSAATAGLMPYQIISGNTGSLAKVSFAASAPAKSQRLAKGSRRSTEAKYN